MNPLNGTITEKHCTKLKVDDNMYKDHEPYLLKLLIEPNNNFAVYINNDVSFIQFTLFPEDHNLLSNLLLKDCYIIYQFSSSIDKVRIRSYII